MIPVNKTENARELVEDSKIPAGLKSVEYVEEGSDPRATWGDGIRFKFDEATPYKPIAVNFALFIKRITGIEQIIDTLEDKPAHLIVYYGAKYFIRSINNETSADFLVQRTSSSHNSEEFGVFVGEEMLCKNRNIIGPYFESINNINDK